MSLYDEIKKSFSLLCNGTPSMIFDGAIYWDDDKKHIWTKGQTAFDYLLENDIIQHTNTFEKYIVVGKHKYEINPDETALYIDVMPYTTKTSVKEESVEHKMNDDYLKDVKISKQQRDKIGYYMCNLSQVGQVYIPPTFETKNRVILDFREALDFLDSITESDDKPDCKLCDGKSLLNQDNNKDLKFNNISHEEKISYLREMLNSMKDGVSQQWLDYNEDIICLLYTSPRPRDDHEYRMPSSA